MRKPDHHQMYVRTADLSQNSGVIGLDPYWIGYYWIGFGWIGSVLLHYWMDWIDNRRSSWIQYPKWVDDHVMPAQHYCGVVCHDCIYPVTTVGSWQSGRAYFITARHLRCQLPAHAARLPTQSP